MNNKVKKEKISGLPIASLVTSIIPLLPVCSLIGLLRAVALGGYSVGYTFNSGLLQIGIIPITLSISAIVCGSISLRRIKAGLYAKKNRGFSITGIVLGAVGITLLVLLFCYLIFWSSEF